MDRIVRSIIRREMAMLVSAWRMLIVGGLLAWVALAGPATAQDKKKVGDAKITYLDIQGTYLKKMRPLDPDFKAMKMPNYRMFSVLFETKENTHLIRVIGPAKTVEQHKKAFDDWLKGFK